LVEAMNEGTRLEPDRVRSVAQLDMLHSLAARLNSLGDVEEIGAAITAELRTIIDYHNCRVYVLQSDGRTLMPVAFRGELLAEYGEETLEELISEVGEGITGTVAARGESLLTPDAREVEFATLIAGTDDILESMLAVPMVAGNDVSGVIVLSSLGYGKFDEEDQRLLEVLASHAAVAIENAKLFQAEREAAETSAALLRLSQVLTGLHTPDAILGEAMETIPRLVRSSAASAYVRDERTGAFRLHSSVTIGPDPPDISGASLVPSEVAQRFLVSITEPFVLPREVVAQVPDEFRLSRSPSEVLVAPLRWEPEGFGALILVAPDTEASFGEGDVRLAGGIADITSLALGNASRLSELERFHELVESLDAVFWESRAGSLGFTFLSRRAADMFGADDAWVSADRSWGEHIVEDDRAAALRALREGGSDGDDTGFEYRVQTPEGGTAWIRDFVHAVRDAQGTVEGYRGLMVDITERKRAEQALRKSERKYSEAFRREREAAQRLRALDEMKNTFLEAVSHDLRTPLTSILGSALTLEQSRLQLAPEDALDLVGRIASNARKLERLLSDLLDLDRLQRGIITPQRRSTDLDALVRHCVDETEHEAAREITVEVDHVTVEVDAAKVERIVENLLSNAIRHTPASAQVWVRASEQDGGVLLVVEDAGPGIAEDLREAVFEPFRQAPGSASMHSPGVGVGLTLVRRFAELHGGRAWVEPREGGGASFRVFLPAA
jgi:PAS domain S-box-containing protein